MCLKVPWQSFQALRSLTYGIYNRRLLSREPFNPDDSPGLIFTGPSCLPNLEDLHVNYCNETSFYDAEELDMSLDAIYRHDLNSTMEDPSSFPSLRNFHARVSCQMSGRATFVLDEKKLLQLVLDRLPAIFRKGGRKETNGWVTSIVPFVFFGVEVILPSRTASDAGSE